MSSSLRAADSYRRQKRTRAGAVALGFVALLVLQMYFFSASSNALPIRQDQKQQEEKKQPLGSLTATGEVYVNDKLAPAETTIFAGDTLRTGEMGTAVFASNCMGSRGIHAVPMISHTTVSKSLAATAHLDNRSGVTLFGAH